MAILGRIALSGVLLLATAQITNASHTPQHELAEEIRPFLPPEDLRFNEALTVCFKELDSISEVSRNRLWGPRLREWLETCVDRELRPKP